MSFINEENNEDIFDINFTASTIEVNDELMSCRSVGTCLCME
ncbi:hypothetical protein [Fluviispira multicolorata]|nr:hypothetical protein [Fluviispira multicolorata]